MKHDYVSMIEHVSNALVNAVDRHPLIGSIIRGSASREDYVEFLGATYHYIRWSGPLLAGTAEGLRRSGRYRWLLELLDQKTDEESPHYAWVLNDLRRCGANVELITSRPAPIAVQAYVQFSRTRAEEGSPAFLGAAYALEFISMRRAKTAAENLCARKAIPNIEHAVSFLAGHGDADPDHIALLTNVLHRIADGRDQAAIMFSAAAIRILYPQFFRAGAPGGEPLSRQHCNPSM